MIAGISGNVPWWGAVLIAVIAACSGPFAIAIQNRHEDQSRKNQLKHAAYEELIAASEVVAFRSTVLAGQRSVTTSISNSLWDFRKAIVVLLMLTRVGRPFKQAPQFLKLFVNAIPTPPPFEDAMDLKSLHVSIEELVKANIGVNLYGSDKAIDAAENLLSDARDFFSLIESGRWTISGLPAKRMVTRSREKMIDSTRAFVAIARFELGPT